MLRNASLVHGYEPLVEWWRRHAGTVTSGRFMPCGGEAGAQRGIVSQPRESPNERTRVVARHEQSVDAIGDDLSRPTRGGGDHGTPGPEPLHDDEAEGLGDPRSVHEHVRVNQIGPWIGDVAHEV